MQLVRPRVIGILKSHKTKRGHFVVTNNEKSPHRIMICCDSIRHGEDIIAKMQHANPGELIHI